MRSFRVGVTIAWAGVCLSSLVSMMAVFMGSGSGDTRALLSFQNALLPVTLAALVVYGWRATRRGDGLVLLWRHTPGWLLFVVASAASLTLIAELSFVLITWHDAGTRPWIEHVPAVTALSASLALAAGYADLAMDDAA